MHRSPAGLRRLYPVAGVAIFYTRLVMINSRTPPVLFVEHHIIAPFVAGNAAITGRRCVVATDAMRRPHAGRAPPGVMRSWTVLGMA